MSPQLECEQALAKSVATCVTVCTSLSVSQQEDNSYSLPVLRNDLLSLFALLRASTTKVSLALNPNKPTYSAAIAPVNDSSAHIAAIAHCASLFSATLFGTSLVDEVHRTVKGVVSAAQELFSNLLASMTGPVSDQYLRLTGSLHELIDQAATSLSVDNRAAVQKQFESNLSLLLDGLSELEDIIQENQSAGKIEEEDDFDAGWDELGLDSSTPLTAEELDTTKKVHLLLKLVSTLLNRVALDHLKPTSSVGDARLLDPLVTHGTFFSTSIDEFVSSLYPPHQPAELRAELLSLRKHLSRLQKDLHELSNDPTSAMASLSVSDGGTKKQKWYQNCFSQIDKALDIVLNHVAED